MGLNQRNRGFSKWLFLLIIAILALIILIIFIYFAKIKKPAEPVTPSSSPLEESTIKKSSRDNPSGPYYHQIYKAISQDGLKWSKTGEIVFDHASVPGAVIKDDLIYLYFVDASGDEDQLSVGISNDLGKTFEKKKVVISGVASYDAVDPSPELVDGKIRLYYLGDFMSSPKKQGNEVFKIYSAESNDGINFSNPQLAIEENQPTTDPDVFQTDKDWRMFLSQGRAMILAISSDKGLSFQKTEGFDWQQGGVSDTIKINDQFRTFYCGAGIQTATGGDTGQLKEEAAVLDSQTEPGKIICDPTIIQLPDSSYLMFYKVQEMPKKD